ncbi:sensor histidine kinase [Thiohalobacter thiocyanaticus]|uniref:histidine kinase n=1 Tax=Thiohalobacter thiocyanaticus TaxID=585455 RepID=A0A426QKD5_9GAMM|nr:HAMP domain-containing sensor histidine kinase [Thiohalobacter thiocyanaticus]RRQ22208.1 sensor histidine kinase [Thiohalobacter thiocyanaticus]
MFYDADGNRIGTSGPTAPAAGSRRAAELVSEGDRQDEFQRVEGGEDVYSYFLPLADSGGRISGLLQVTRRTSEFSDYIARLRYQGLAVLIVTTLLLTAVIYVGHHKAVGSHVRAMLTVMRQVSRGQRDRRLPTRGPRELSQLAVGINRMLESLTTQREVLDRHRREQARLEDRLHQSERMAAIGRLAAGVAHELGAPLNVVDGKAQRALRQPGLEPGLAQGLEDIRHEVRRMNFIVRQLMDFGRSNPLQCQPERADRLVRAVQAQFGDEAGRRGIALEVTGDEPVPVLSLDRLRMEQALSNLARNALHAASTRVRLGWFGGGGQAGFVIEDDGPGIPEAERGKVFEPFYTTKGVAEGTGLGLAVAAAAVKDHGGSIEIDTSPLGGARFRILLDSPALETPA